MAEEFSKKSKRLSKIYKNIKNRPIIDRLDYIYHITKSTGKNGKEIFHDMIMLYELMLIEEA